MRPSQMSEASTMRCSSMRRAGTGVNQSTSMTTVPSSWESRRVQFWKALVVK